MIQRGAAAEYTYDTSYANQARYQAAERQAQAANRGVWGTCGGTNVRLFAPPSSAPPPAPSPVTSAPPAPVSNCAPGYSPCIPPYPPDLDCADIGFTVHVTGSDPHGLDADGDGYACES